jgi:hypothetical protein
MNLPRDPERDLERLLEDDGGELGALYRRLPKAEPPRRLDRSVLGQAARAVHGYTPRRQRWLVGLGSAAGIVLAAGMAWHVGQDALRQETQSVAPPTRPTYVPVEPIGEISQRRAHEEAPLQDATRAAPASAPAAAAPPPLPKPSAPMRKSESKAKDNAPAPQPPPVAITPPPPAAAKPAEPAAQAFPADSADRAQSVDQTAAGAGAAKATAPEAEREIDRQRLRNAAPAPSSSVELRRDMQLAPDEWLGHIRQLMHQGRRQQASESLRLFRNAHPDRAVPRDLRALLD